MANISASYYGAGPTINGGRRRIAAPGSPTSTGARSSKLTGLSHLGHLGAFSPVISAAGASSSTARRTSRSLRPSRGFTRSKPIQVHASGSARAPFLPVNGEHVTYHTNHLGLFEGQSSVPLSSQVPPALSNLVPPTDNVPQPRRLDGYQYVGGWTVNAQGQNVYIPTGHIEEVDDIEDEDLMEVEAMLDDSQASPRMLPPHTTPPPRPKPAVWQLLPSGLGMTPVASPPSPSSPALPPLPLPGISSLPDSACKPLPQSSPPQHAFSSYSSRSSQSSPSVYEASSTSYPPPLSPFLPSAPTTTSKSSDPSDFAEFLRDENVIDTNLESIKHLCDTFTFLGPLRQDNHIGTCQLLVRALHRVRDSLLRARNIPNDVWKFLSDPKRLNFRDRLDSLHRTLLRLHKVSSRLTLLENELWGRIIDKLGDHHKKLSDIASKLDTTFDLLQLHSLHEVANESNRQSSAVRYLNAREHYLRRKASRTSVGDF